MKIAVLGAANSSHTVKIVNSLSAMGNQIRLYSMASHVDEDGAVSDQVPVIYLTAASYFSAHKQLKRELADFSPDVLYAHYASGYGTVAKKTGFHPTVLAVWGSDVYEFPKRSPLHAWILRGNLNFADRVFSTSQIMAKHTAGYTKKQIVITPFGVDLNAFSPMEKPNEQGRPFRVGFLKSIAPVYGIEDLIRGFGMLTDRLPDRPMELAVYGDGCQLEEMKRLAEELGISRQVFFYGRVPHSKAPEVLHTFDVLCVPSLQESFGVVAVEGMACGLPCVVSRADGLREVTEEGVTAITVPCQDPGAICDALEQLVIDPQAGRRMGQAGRKRAEDLYDWDKNIRLIEKELLITAGLD